MAQKRRKPKKLLTWKRCEWKGYRASLAHELYLDIDRKYDMWELRLAEGFFSAHIAFGSLQEMKQYGERVARRYQRNQEDWWK